MPVGEKLKKDDQNAPWAGREELKHEKAEKSAHDVEDAGTLIKESKPI